MCYMPLFWHNTGVWRTDGRTDGQTDGRTDGIAVANTALAMRALRRAVKMNLSTAKWAQWDKTQSKELLGLFIRVCIALCTIVAHNIAQNRPDNFPSYPPDNHHCSDVCLFQRRGTYRSDRSTDFRKDVPFWGFVDMAPHLGGQIPAPKKTNLGRE